MKTTAANFPSLGQRRVRDPYPDCERSGRREPTQTGPSNSLEETRPENETWLVEVRPDEELPVGFCVSPLRVLVPTALDEASAVALDYASALAGRFGSEIALLYASEDHLSAGNSRAEAELWACFSALGLRQPKVRLFLRAGRTGQQVKAVAEALGSDLVVTSRDYHRRFLSCLTHPESGTLRVGGVSCPIVLVKNPWDFS
jgi:nucleotide-binding universal stress UspA family protein